MTFRELQIGDLFFFKKEIGKNQLLYKVSEFDAGFVGIENRGKLWILEDSEINEKVIKYENHS
jgi:hypothetical protein